MPNEVEQTAGNYTDLEAVFRELFYLCLAERYTCLPCKVVAVNVDIQTVDIQPTIKSYFRGPKVHVERPIIKGVPFWMFRAGDTYITLPIKPGDTGLAIFCQRDITNWKESGGVATIQSERVMDYNDAIFLPFVGAKTQAVSNYNPNFIEIVKNGKTITVKDGTLDAPDYAINCKSLHATGTVVSDTDCISGGISGKTHRHVGVRSGDQTSGEPV